MADAAAILAWELGEVGYTERPRGSNCNKYGHELGINCQPWCAVFQVKAYLVHGIDLRRYCDNPYYTPNLYGDLKALGWAVSPSKAGQADLMFFNWSGVRIQHVEAVVENRWPSMVMVGGNTSDHGGSQDNGGEVAKQTRSSRGMVGAIHVPMVTKKLSQADDTMNELKKLIFYCKQFRFGDPKAPNNEHSEGAGIALQVLQKGINRWNDQFAAMVKAPNPPDIAITGKWDDPTRFCVAVIQQLTKRNEYGVTGPQFWETIYR